jgi:hypothetical protein
VWTWRTELLDLFAINRGSERHKDLQILILLRQLRILQRQHPTAPPMSCSEKFILTVLAQKLVHVDQGAKAQLNQTMLLFKPDTVLKWHRQLVRRKRDNYNADVFAAPHRNCQPRRTISRSFCYSMRLARNACTCCRLGIPPRPPRYWLFMAATPLARAAASANFIPRRRPNKNAPW